MDLGLKGKVAAAEARDLRRLDNLILSNSLRAGVAGLAKSLANELGRDGILVNTVCPGTTMTDRFLTVHRGLAARQGVAVEEVIAARAKEVPLGGFTRGLL